MPDLSKSNLTSKWLSLLDDNSIDLNYFEYPYDQDFCIISTLDRSVSIKSKIKIDNLIILLDKNIPPVLKYIRDKLEFCLVDIETINKDSLKIYIILDSISTTTINDLLEQIPHTQNDLTKNKKIFMISIKFNKLEISEYEYWWTTESPNKLNVLRYNSNKEFIQQDIETFNNIDTFTRSVLDIDTLFYGVTKITRANSKMISWKIENIPKELKEFFISRMKEFEKKHETPNNNI